MLSNQSKEITKSEMSMALSCFHEKYSLRLVFCRNYISMKSCKRVYISALVMGCHSFALEGFEKNIGSRIL
jgi:hypothetical protein